MNQTYWFRCPLCENDYSEDRPKKDRDKPGPECHGATYRIDEAYVSKGTAFFEDVGCTGGVIRGMRTGGGDLSIFLSGSTNATITDAVLGTTVAIEARGTRGLTVSDVEHDPKLGPTDL